MANLLEQIKEFLAGNKNTGLRNEYLKSDLLIFARDLVNGKLDLGDGKPSIVVGYLNKDKNKLVDVLTIKDGDPKTGTIYYYDNDTKKIMDCNGVQYSNTDISYSREGAIEFEPFNVTALKGVNDLQMDTLQTRYLTNFLLEPRVVKVKTIKRMVGELEKSVARVYKYTPPKNVTKSKVLSDNEKNF